MEKEVILKVENLSKQYRLGTVGTGTISHDFNRFLAKIRGKEDPYLKVGESNNRATKGESEYVWALKDINFEVKKGEVLGIIGKNGAGKSTLLKILSKVTGPTTGSIKSKGRIASLLEVGTGFHPEMTGRENVFLNGAILGMTKKEISEKLDEIVEFSGCERYIDTPVKRYSSGMKVRLAFAVAAHLEPDILIVDEVLAVGDAEFQKKAIGKMQDISNSDGRTVLFVSHDLVAIKSLCFRGVLLEDGKVSCIGEIEEVLNQYESLNLKKVLKNDTAFFDFKKQFGIQSIKTFSNNKQTRIIKAGSEFKIEFTYNVKEDYFAPELGIGICNNKRESIMRFNNLHVGFPLKITKGTNIVNLIISNFPIYREGEYYITIYFGSLSNFEALEDAFSIKVKGDNVFNSSRILENKHNLIIHKEISYSQP